MLILMYQQIKKAPGKLMNILLKLSPKILTHRKEIKPSKQRIAVWVHSRAPFWA